MLISFNASTCLPQLSKQLFMVCSILCMSPAASSSISALFILPCTSLSSIKHSMFNGIGVEFALISFFSFSHSVVKRTYALGFLWASTWILKQNYFFNFFFTLSSLPFPKTKKLICFICVNGKQ